MTTKDDEMTRDETADDLAQAEADAMLDDDLDEPVDAEALAETARRRMRRVASQVYSIRIPVDRLEDLRQLAAARNEAPSALIRRWVLQRLDAETLGEDVVVANEPGALAATIESLQRSVESLNVVVECLAPLVLRIAAAPPSSGDGRPRLVLFDADDRPLYELVVPPVPAAVYADERSANR